MSMDKKYWPEGEWQNEPDRLDFEYKGYKCCIIRNWGGALCGYVALPKGSKWEAQDPDIVDSIDVHGGITWQDHRLPCELEEGEFYWVGFDCSHYNDLRPADLANQIMLNKLMEIKTEDHEILGSILMRQLKNASYRNIEYVTNECKKVVDQILKEENE